MRKFLKMAGVFLAATVMAGGLASATDIGGSDPINGCYNTATGVLRVVDDTQCLVGETAISWNRTGPQGPKGDRGEPGIDGTNGVNGTNGADGVDGINGTNGVNGTNGADGAPGTPGAQGLQGPMGPMGATGPRGPAGTGNAAGSVQASNQFPVLTPNIWVFIREEELIIPSGASHKVLVTGQYTAKGGTRGVRVTLNGQSLPNVDPAWGQAVTQDAGWDTLPVSFIVTVSPGSQTFTLQARTDSTMDVWLRELSVVDLGPVS